MNNYVTQIQTLLQESGFYTGKIDGIVGGLTLNAVKAVLENKTEPPKSTLSNRSLENLKGVDKDLVNVVMLASQKTKQEFIVTEGLRSIERQKEMVAQKLSQTMNSNHLTGRAVDLAPIVGGKVCWDLLYFFPIVEAMQEAAKELGIKVRWGGAWVILNNAKESPQSLLNGYVARRKKLGKKPFVDGPHFEVLK